MITLAIFKATVPRPASRRQLLCSSSPCCTTQGNAFGACLRRVQHLLAARNLAQRPSMGRKRERIFICQLSPTCNLGIPTKEELGASRGLTLTLNLNNLIGVRYIQAGSRTRHSPVEPRPSASIPSGNLASAEADLIPSASIASKKGVTCMPKELANAP